MGLPVLFGEDGRPIRIRVNKHLALLTYLAMEPKARHRRGELAEMLWPAGEQRHSLSMALTVLRASLGQDAIETTPATVALSEVAIETDIDRLVADQSASNIPLPPLEIEPFLHGFDVGDAIGFMQWRDGQAARLRPVMRRAVLKQLEESRNRGEHREMERHALSLLALDCLDEEAIRAQLEVRALAGDRVGALSLYERWKARFKEELGAEPSVGTTDLVKRLRRGDWEVAYPSPSGPQAEGKATDLIGRESILERISKAWISTRSGDPHHTILHGPSGVGKTAVLQAAATQAKVSGAYSLFLAAVPSMSKTPFALLHLLIKRLAVAPGFNGASRSSLDQLGTVVPSLSQDSPNPSVAEPSESATRHLADALADVLAALSDERPLFLTLDDIDFADVASLHVIGLAVHFTGRHPVGLAVGVSTLAFDRLSAVRDFCETLDPRSKGHILVNPLDDDASWLLITSRIGAPARSMPAFTRRQLLSTGGGSPQLLTILADEWHIHGSEAAPLAMHGFGAAGIGNGPFVTRYRTLVERRTQRLNDNAKTVLAALSVTGASQHLSGAVIAAGITPTQLLAALSDLEAAGIIKTSGGDSAFVDGVVRAIVYDGIAPAARKELHLVAARALEGIEDDFRPTGRLERIWHLLKSGRRDRQTIECFIASAAHAVEHDYPDEALWALQTADIGDAATAVHAYACQLQLTCKFLLHRWGDLASSPLMEPDSLGLHNLGNAVIELSRLRTGRSATTDSQTAAMAFAQVLESTEDSFAHDCSLYALARWSAVLGDDLLRRTTRDLLERTPRQATGSRAILRLLAEAHLAFAERRRGECETFLTRAEELAVSVRRHGQLHLCATSGRAHLATTQGLYEEAIEHAERAHLTATRLMDSLAQQELESALACAYGRLGDSEAQARWAERAIEASGADSGATNYIASCYHAGMSQLVLGDTTRAEAAMARLSTAIRQWPHGHKSTAGRLYLADLLWVHGDTEAAIALATEAVTEADGMHDLAGIVARWLCALILSGKDSMTRRRQLVEMSDHYRGYDALDCYEVARAMELCIPGERHRISQIRAYADRSFGPLPNSATAWSKRFLRVVEEMSIGGVA